MLQPLVVMLVGLAGVLVVVLALVEQPPAGVALVVVVASHDLALPAGRVAWMRGSLSVVEVMTRMGVREYPKSMKSHRSVPVPDGDPGEDWWTGRAAAFCSPSRTAAR